MNPVAKRWLWLCLAVCLCLSSCNTSPDKRLLQYLNTDGFGNRYRGNAEEENWLAIGDSLGLTDAYHPTELNVNVPVDIDGTVLLPELGAVSVAGLTRTEIEALLMEKYSPYYDLLDLKVRIFTKGKRYFIFGEVTQTGAEDFPGDLTIFEAVMKAKPKTDSANLGRVRLIRADPRDPFVMTINVGDMLAAGDSTFNVHVQERDIIFVPATMLAELGYFIKALLFPVTLTIQTISDAFFAYNRFDRNYNNYGF